MKFSFNLVFQIVAMVAQVGAQYADVIPLKYKPAAALVVGVAQAIVAWKAHYSNPDGTSAAVAYVK